RDARGRLRARVGRDVPLLREEKWKDPFQKKNLVSISREKLDLQSAKKYSDAEDGGSHCFVSLLTSSGASAAPVRAGSSAPGSTRTNDTNKRSIHVLAVRFPNRAFPIETRDGSDLSKD